MPVDHRRRARTLLLVTFLLFFVPIVGAWLLNIFAPDWRPFGTINHGTLVQPVRAVVTSGLAHADGTEVGAGYLSGRWTLVHVPGGACARDCVDALARTRQVRRALGEDMKRVQRLVVGADAAHAGLIEPAPDLTFAVADSAWLASFSFADAGAGPLPGVYLIDPQGYLMMRYPPDVEVRGLLADLQRLLKISKIG
jgi:cytochrome oxidase Cu insertion factor (SCO1/SenC/PrrC family)